MSDPLVKYEEKLLTAAIANMNTLVDVAILTANSLGKPKTERTMRWVKRVLTGLQE